MITGDMTREHGVRLDGPSGVSRSELGSDPEGSSAAFANMLQEMTSHQDSEQRRSDLSALGAGAAASPVLEIPAGATRLSQAGVKSLVHMLWTAVMAGEETAAVKVLPRELGTLLLNIKVVDNGVYIEAKADDPRVVSLLRASILELAEGLAQRGLVLRGFRADTAAPDRDDPGAAQQAAPAEKPTDSEDTERNIAEKNIDAPRRSFIEVVI